MKNVVKSLVLILVAASFVSSQSANGSISGTVQDSFGALIPNIEVKLVRSVKEKEETVRRTTSNHEGAYSFSNIPLGVYELQVKWFSDHILRKRVELTSSRTVQNKIDISNKPCSDEFEMASVAPITNSDRGEIVKELLNL